MLFLIFLSRDSECHQCNKSSLVPLCSHHPNPKSRVSSRQRSHTLDALHLRNDPHPIPGRKTRGTRNMARPDFGFWSVHPCPVEAQSPESNMTCNKEFAYYVLHTLCLSCLQFKGIFKFLTVFLHPAVAKNISTCRKYSWSKHGGLPHLRMPRQFESRVIRTADIQKPPRSSRRQLVQTISPSRHKVTRDDVQPMSKC